MGIRRTAAIDLALASYDPYSVDRAANDLRRSRLQKTPPIAGAVPQALHALDP